jgi:hypothetical protein
MTIESASKAIGCPACEVGHLEAIDIPHNLYRCVQCGEVAQQVGPGITEVAPIGALLKRNAMGDDRLRSATSTPHVNTVKSFLDIHDNSHRILNLNMAEARGGLRTVLAQAENRLDYAIGIFSGYALASDEAAAALTALREARDLVSIKPGRQRGLAVAGPKDSDDSVP